jgi:hypothetical protein
VEFIVATFKSPTQAIALVSAGARDIHPNQGLFSDLHDCHSQYSHKAVKIYKYLSTPRSPKILAGAPYRL